MVIVSSGLTRKPPGLAAAITNVGTGGAGDGNFGLPCSVPSGSRGRPAGSSPLTRPYAGRGTPSDLKTYLYVVLTLPSGGEIWANTLGLVTPCPSVDAALRMSARAWSAALDEK